MSNPHFIVSSELSHLEGLARRPYEVVHLSRAAFLEASLPSLAARAYSEAGVSTAGDIDTHSVRHEVLCSLAPQVENLMAQLAGALHASGVYGAHAERSLTALEDRTDFLCSFGAPFHNDVVGHWPECLFWVLVLDATNAEFVMPSLSYRHPLQPGDLLVFDPSLPHGLCRPSDNGRSVPFERGEPGSHQAFLSGELFLEQDEWRTLGCPWGPCTNTSDQSAVNLLMADIEPVSGEVFAKHGA